MSRQQLVQLLRASIACGYCGGWGKLWFPVGRLDSPLEVPPRWGYEGWPIPLLGILGMGPEPAICPFCEGTGDLPR